MEYMLKQIEFACAGILLVAIVVLVGVASIARAVGSPIIWSIEMAQLTFVWLCMLAADIGMQENRHFGLQILQDNISPKARDLVELFNIVVIIGFLAFLLYYAWGNMILMHPRLVGATQIHASYIHASMVVGLILLMRTMVFKLIERIRSRGQF